MAPDGAGRFCTHCSKTVIDFTVLTDKQIIDLLNTRKEELCGRFETGQLNRDLSKPQFSSKRINRFKELFAALLMFISAKEVTAAKPEIVNTVIVQPEYAVLEETNNKEDTTSSVLSGVVIDSATDASVAYAVIQNVTRNTTELADEMGNFNINASIGDIIQVSLWNYVTNTFSVINYSRKTCVLKKSEITPGAVKNIRMGRF